MWLLSPSPGFAVRVLVAVVVAWLLAGGTARAACGDYVHILPPGVAATEPHPEPAGHCPCADGRCDQPTPTTPTPTDTVERNPRASDAVLETPATVTRPTRRFAVADDEAEPSHVTPLIFHPPRG